jgi:ParB/RepB/Spo0J family partition protein
MSKIFDLNVIDHNPYQLRESEDPEHVKKLALSIARDTMLQIPMGRKWGSHVQLAFGHSRLAAYKFLRDTGNQGFDFMPVEIRLLDDQQMFELGVKENVDRKNLTPIEEAKAMLIYRDQFGKTSEEIGKLFGNLSDSAVRNKMRLLKLPADIQKCLSTGEMLEGAARAMLPLLDLNELERLAAEEQDEYVKPSEIIELARIGTGQKRITELMDVLMDRLRPAAIQPIPGKLEELPLETVPAPPAEPIPTLSPEEIPALKIEVELEKGESAQPVVEQKSEMPAAHDPVVMLSTGPVPVKVSAPSPAPAPAVQSAQPPEPVKPKNWSESTITLTVTFWPEDGNEKGRIAMIGARLNDNPPRMIMAHQADLVLPQQLNDLMIDLRKSIGDEQ